MKILHVITGLDIGGAETMVYRLLREMQGNNHSFEVVNLRRGGAMQEKIEGLGISVVCLEMTSVFSLCPAVWRLRKRIKTTNPDVIQAWMYHSNLAAFLAWILAGARPRLYWSIHNTLNSPDQISRNTALILFLIKLGSVLSRWVTGIIFNSTLAAQQHHRLGYQKDKEKIIFNGVDPAELKPNQDEARRFRAEMGVTDSTPLIGLVARFDPTKDHQTFLAAASILRRSRPDVHFILVGPGIDNENIKLMSLVKKYHINQNLHLLGPRSDLPGLYTALTIATNSSKTESFPVVVCESMSCGALNVVTDVGESAYLVGETGVVVRSEDPNALAKAWETVLKWPDAEKSKRKKAARQRIIDHFSISKIAADYIAIYHAGL